MAIYAYPHTTQSTPQLADFVMQKYLMKVTTGLVRAGYMLQHVLVAVKIVFFKRSIVWLCLARLLLIRKSRVFIGCF
jgi:hypothetical protein